MLEKESGYQIQSVNVKQLFLAINERNFQACFYFIKLINFTIEKKEIERMFVELMFIQMILKKQHKEALNLLRNELQPLISDKLK